VFILGSRLLSVNAVYNNARALGAEGFDATQRRSFKIY